MSILFGVAPSHIRLIAAECHEAAVDDELAHLEREACRARRGKDGVLQVGGAGFLAAGYRHRTSRAGDPLLHTHVVVANRTQGPDDRWTALDARPLYAHAKTAGFVYQARLREQVSQRLGLQWGPVTKGSAYLTGFSRELIEHFSTRRAEIVAELERHGEHSLLAAQTAALATRRGKDYVTAPNEFLNEPSGPILGRDELVDFVARSFESERRQELAIETLAPDRAGPDLSDHGFDMGM